MIADSVEEQRILCSTISLRRSGYYGCDLIEEKWRSYLAILLRSGRHVWRFGSGQMDVTISDSVDDLFEESDVVLGNLFYD
jgi:hypothetical protein